MLYSNEFSIDLILEFISTSVLGWVRGMSSHEKDSPEQGEPSDKEKMPKVLFDLGRIVITPGAAMSLRIAQHHCVQFLARHVTGDWGDLPEEDIEENKYSLDKGFRIFSAYDLDTGGKIYVITEWDRSVTTLLLPEEY
jgi:hypothetical protein